MTEAPEGSFGPGGVLLALSRDRTGSTLAMMAAMLVPMTLLAGSAVDVSRVFMVQARLQQACDAGVLAGRKSMTDLTSQTLDNAAAAQATAFFNHNFPANWMNTEAVSFTPTKTTANQVNGVAVATVPYTIMRMIGVQSKTISATCRARFDVADTDIIFVLDTTGSMACAPADSTSTCNNYVGGATVSSYLRPNAGNGVAGYGGTTGYKVAEKSGSRIEALRQAVLNFYDTFAANADPSTHVRYGFVTYTSSVNAGKAITEISPTYMVGGAGNTTTTWNYQSRKVTGDYNIGSQTSTTASASDSSSCAAYGGRIPAGTTGQPFVYDPNNGRAVVKTTNWNGGVCQVYSQTVGPQWLYQELPLDVSQLVAGNTVTDPTKVNGSTTSWVGCVEERDTTASSSFSQSSLSADLDPDLVPSSDANRWRPMWEDAIYLRYGYGSTANATSNGDSSSHPPINTQTYRQRGYTTCGKPVARLSVMTRQQVNDYVYAADFKAIGGTYHDVGMIWGTRLISPTGLFAADTASWPNSPAAPKRVIIFLTDGDMAPSTAIYGQYGVEYYDQRVAGGSSSNLTAYHNTRFTTECSAAKARDIDIWTITIGSTITTQMSSCATLPTQALSTTSGTDLSAKFAAIASQLAMLRLTQ